MYRKARTKRITSGMVLPIFSLTNLNQQKMRRSRLALIFKDKGADTCQKGDFLNIVANGMTRQQITSFGGERRFSL